MAQYFLHVKTFSRGQGSRVTKAAAYRAGERIRDARTSAVYDHSDRTDVACAEIVLPSDLAVDPELAWARDRSSLWNTAEGVGRQWNSRLAREVLVFVPPELTAAQRAALVRSYSQEIADRFRNAVDFSVHEPRPAADARHHHAHLLMTTREVGAAGLGRRTSMDLSGEERRARGLGHSKEDLLWLRERWSSLANEALHAAGSTARIDHRSYAAQGLDREPTPRIPRTILYQEKKSGVPSPAGEAIRARYRERVEARARGPKALAEVVERQRRENQQRAIVAAERRAANTKTPTGALTREEINAQRREWRKANRDHVNARQKAYRQRHAAEDAAKRWAEKRQHPTTAAEPSAEDAVKQWLKFREHGVEAAPNAGAESETAQPGRGSGRRREPGASL